MPGLGHGWAALPHLFPRGRRRQQEVVFWEGFAPFSNVYCLALALQEELEEARRGRQGEGGGCSPAGPGGVRKSLQAVGSTRSPPRSPHASPTQRGVLSRTSLELWFHFTRRAMVNECRPRHISGHTVFLFSVVPIL